jgi:sugar phosphate isomerase/epimerase
MNGLPFRTGSTSFVYHADILTNVRRLAPLVDDIELVLFIVEDKGNIPSPRLVKTLHAIAREHSISYTVHLPLGIQLGSVNEAVRKQSVSVAKKIINATAGLFPWAYIIHLDARIPCMKEMFHNPDTWFFWREACCKSLDQLIRICEKPELLCIENLESYSFDRLIPVITGTHVGFCLDIGHLWMRGSGPVKIIEDNINLIRVIHLHGIRKRDHVSLIHTNTSELHAIFDTLKQTGYGGVVTIEVFSEQDFFSSIDCIALWEAGIHNKNKGGIVWQEN